MEKPNFDCHDCGQCTFDIHEYYMVHNRIWARLGVPRRSMLCIGCLENRLGRTLNRSDFTDFPVNRGPTHHGRHLKSDRLRNRLGVAGHIKNLRGRPQEVAGYAE